MNKPKKRGRPKIELDYTMAERYGSIMCTMQEIAVLMGVSISKLEQDEEFIRAYKNGLERGRMSLRRSQVKAAEAGNPTMLIWLGKQYLGQRDKQEIEHTSPQPITFRFDKGEDGEG